MIPELVFVAGARPNFMKVAPMLRAAETRRAPFASRLVHTGQHYDSAMSGVFFEELGIPAPDAHLNVGSGPHGAQTARVLESFEAWLIERGERVRGVVVVGDVNSTVACTLAAAKLGIPVAHVEAGLRSFDRAMPEEINRMVTDSIADLLLPSEPAGVENLTREGVAASRIAFVGNTMIDTVAHQLPRARALDVPLSLGLRAHDYVLVTLHRPSNVDDPARLAELVALISRVAERAPVVFPAHPRTRARLDAAGLTRTLSANQRVRLLDPIAYRQNLGLMADAKLVLTDSGGIQEETTWLGVPCLTLRANTERPVTVDRGTNTLVGDDLGLAERLVNDIFAGRYKAGAPVDGWDGKAAERVIQVLTERWG